MEEIKLLHTADLHIDWLFDKFSASAKKIRRQELIQSLVIITDIAIQQQVKAVLISGDLFNSPSVDRATLASVTACFQRLGDENIFVLILPGNHDLLSPNGVFDLAVFPENVHVFMEKEWTCFDKLNGLKIYGIPYCEELKDINVLNHLQVDHANGYNVALLHGSYQDSRNFENYMPFNSKDIAASGLNYLALGHYHNYRDCSSGSVKCIYPGSPSYLSFNESGSRQAVIVKLTPHGTDVTPVTIPSRKYIQLEYDMTFGSPEELFQKLNSIEDRTACVRLIFKGFIDENKFINAGQINESFREKFFYFETIDQTEFLPDEEVNEFSIKGIFLKKMNSMLNNPKLSPDEKEIIENALKIGYIALERGRLD